MLLQTSPQGRIGVCTIMFEGKKIRSCKCGSSGKIWLSAVDMCALIRGVDYQKARRYWKWLKTKLYRQPSGVVSGYHQIKMVAADGKLRKTDVVDAEGAIALINACPSPEAMPYKIWLCELDAAGEDAAGLISDAVTTVKHKTGNELYTITRKSIYRRSDVPVPAYAIYPHVPVQWLQTRLHRHAA